MAVQLAINAKHWKTSKTQASHPVVAV